MDIKPLSFEWHLGEVRLLFGWLEEIAVSRGLLDTADPAFLCRDEDLLHFEVANGSATYRITGEDANFIYARRMSWKGDEPEYPHREVRYDP